MSIQRTFSFGKAILDFIEPTLYIDGTGIQASVALLDVVIARWDELSTSDQNSITNFLAAKGFNFARDDTV